MNEIRQLLLRYAGRSAAPVGSIGWIPPIESDRTMHASRISARLPPSILLRYSLASVAAALALLLTLLIRPILHEPLFSLFYVAVLVSSWYGGLGPGLLTTVLSILLADYY